MKVMQKICMILIFVSVPYTVFAQEYLLRTQSPVSSCVFSPDGRFFAAAWKNQVAFWDTDSCSVLNVCADYPGDVISIKFSPDSQNLLVVCDGGILCVNSIDNFELSTLLETDFDKNILDADFDGDYSVLIPSGGKNLNSYFLLRYTSQVIQKKLGGHNGTVFRIETAKQSEKPVAVSTSLDGQALVWDLSSYSLINEFHCNVENALPAVISPDGTKIFYAANGENLIVSGIDGSNPLTIQETGAVQTASFSGDGALIAFAVKDGGIKVYDTVSGNIAAEFPSLCNNGEKETEDQISSINSIAFNPAGKNILVGCENGCLFLWDIDDNSGLKQTFLAAGTGSGKQSGNLPPQDGLQVADGENSAGSTTATVWLETGKTYTATIKAENSIGESDTVDCVDTEINLFTVTYQLDEGKVKYGAADTDATDGADQTAFVLPYNKNANVQPLLGADTADIPHVFKDGYQFQEWQDTASLTPGPGTPVAEIAAGNADNMDVTAVWQKALTVNVTFPSYAEAQSVQLLDTYSEAAVITKPKTEPSVEVTAATPATGGTLNNVVYIVYNIDGTTPVTAGVDDDGAGKLTWTFANTTGLTAGVYRIYVTADYTGTDTTVTPLSGNLYIKITE